MGMKAVAGGAALPISGICIMHYSGMHAMKMQPGSIWNPVLVATSALIAFLASGVALWIVFHLRRITSRRQLLARIGAALVMGFAVVSMHYTGMAAASFPLGAICGAADGLTGAWTAGPIATFQLLLSLLIMALRSEEPRVGKGGVGK